MVFLLGVGFPPLRLSPWCFVIDFCFILDRVVVGSLVSAYASFSHLLSSSSFVLDFYFVFVFVSSATTLTP